MVLFDFHVGLPLHIVEHLCAGHFFLETTRHVLEPRRHVEPLDGFVAIGNLESGARGREIGEGRGVACQSAEQSRELRGK